MKARCNSTNQLHQVLAAKEKEHKNTKGMHRATKMIFHESRTMNMTMMVMIINYQCHTHNRYGW